MGKEEKDRLEDLMTEEGSQGKTAVEEDTKENEREETHTEEEKEDSARREHRNRNKSRGDGRRKKARKGNHVARSFLRILQHLSLATMAVSVFVVAI